MSEKRGLILFGLVAAGAFGLRAAWRSALQEPASAPMQTLPVLPPPAPTLKQSAQSLYSRPPSDAPRGAPPAAFPRGEEPGNVNLARGDDGLGSASGAVPAPQNPPRWMTPPNAGGGGWSGHSYDGSGPTASAAPSPAAPAKAPAPSPVLDRLTKLATRAPGPAPVMLALTPASGGTAPAPSPSNGSAADAPAAASAAPASSPDSPVPAATPAAPDGASAGSRAAPAADASAAPSDSGAPAAATDASSVPGADASTSSGTADGSDQDSTVADITPVVGAPQVSGGKPSDHLFAAKRGMAPTVPIVDIQAGNLQGVAFKSDMFIDPNGSGGWYKRDKMGRPKTALKYPDKTSLNPGRIPYIVIPSDFRKYYPNVKMGDYAAVSYGGRTVYAIVGDVGPKGVIGAGSIAVAKGLGIDPDPRKGGIGGGVDYVILEGTADRVPPRDAAQVEAEGRALFGNAGIPVQ